MVFLIQVTLLSKLSSILEMAIISIISFTLCNLWNIRCLQVKLHCHFSFTFVTLGNAVIWFHRFHIS